MFDPVACSISSMGVFATAACGLALRPRFRVADTATLCEQGSLHTKRLEQGVSGSRQNIPTMTYVAHPARQTSLGPEIPRVCSVHRQLVHSLPTVETYAKS